VSITLFFVDAFTSALDRGIASANDIIRHVTPDVLAAHLPRHLWARLLTACLGASRVDANTIVDTVGIPNLCEHMPKPLLWTCLAEIAATALGGARLSSSGRSSSPMIPAPTAPLAAGTTTSGAVSSAGVGATATAPTAVRSTRGSSPEMLLPPPPASSRPASNPGEPIAPPPPAAGEPALEPGRARTPTRPPVRGLGTSRMAAAGASSRRPQAAAPAGPGPAVPSPGRSTTTPISMPAQTVRRDELDFEIETDIRTDWKGGKDPIPVDDEQLVDWSANEETASGNSIDLNRPKR
jgi:hypothetical protein